MRNNNLIQLLDKPGSGMACSDTLLYMKIYFQIFLKTLKFSSFAMHFFFTYTYFLVTLPYYFSILRKSFLFPVENVISPLFSGAAVAGHCRLIRCHVIL